MKIPKKFMKDNREYEFVQRINDKLFLYRNVKTKTNTAFSRFDLNGIDNRELDKKIHIINRPKLKVLVYDRLSEKETIYDNTEETAKALDATKTIIERRMRNKQWHNNRWFIERIEEWN